MSESKEDGRTAKGTVNNDDLCNPAARRPTLQNSFRVGNVLTEGTKFMDINGLRTL